MEAVGPMQLARVERDAPRVRACGLPVEYLFELHRERLALREHALFAVQPGRAWIEVVAADEERTAVDRERLGMQACAR